MTTATAEPSAAVDSESEARIVREARDCMESCNWRLGELAAEWIEATGKTDAEFGAKIGFTKKQVQQRRAVWQKFGGNSGSPYDELRTKLSWTHFRVALTWDEADAFDCLEWAGIMEATSAEMRVWRAAQRGEDLMAANDDSDVIDEEISGLLQTVVDPQPQGKSKNADPTESGKANQNGSTSSAGGAPREKTRQPRSVDPAKFNEMEEIDHVVASCRDLAAPFFAAGKLEAFIRALRAVTSEFSTELAKINANE